MMRKQYLASIIICFIWFTSITVSAENVNPSAAVKGYGDYKWGMTIAEVQAKNPCDLKDSGTDRYGIHTFYCSDFDFASKNRIAFFMFINEKLQRVGVKIEPEEVYYLTQALNEKFGESSGELKMVKTTIASPGTKKWADESIFLKVIENKSLNKDKSEQQSDQPQKYIVTLIYTSRDFESSYKKKQIDKFKSSIGRK